MADALEPDQLTTYFALMEAVRLLHHEVSRQLRADGDLSYVQFEILARLADREGPLTMTEVADGVVYSRSGLTHQAGLLEKSGLISRGPSPGDQRATVVAITEAGRELIATLLPKHVEVARGMLFDPLSAQDVDALGDIMTRVRDHMRARPPRSAGTRRRRGPVGTEG